MTKAIAIVIFLMLTACIHSPEQRSASLIQTEKVMQQGLTYYKKDHYSQAIQAFESALALYQSIDDQQGINLAKINLIESALAISRFKIAKKNLDSFENKIILLEARYFFLQQQYALALKTLQPLVSQLPESSDQLSYKQINLLLTHSKFAIFAHSPEANLKFNELISRNLSLSGSQNALFNRLAAHIASQKGDYSKAIALQQQAIEFYKANTNRRAISSCLEEMAKINLANKKYTAAIEQTSRALLIRQWLQDDYKSNQLAILLAQLKHKPRP